MRFKFKSLALVVSLTLTGIYPAESAENHSDGYVSTTFSSLTVNRSQYLLAKFIPLKIDGLENSGKDRWTNFYHLDLQWESGDPTKPIYSYIRFGTYKRVNDTIFGNLDFWVRGATDVRVRTGSVCELDAWGKTEIRKINGTDTRSSQCWRGISIKAGKEYAFSLKPDNNLGENWWYASLIESDNPANELIVGSIKLFSKNSSLTINNSSWSLTYSGDKKPCNEVPSMDSQIWPVQNSAGDVSKYITSSIGKCLVGSVNLDQNKNVWNVKFGGSQTAGLTNQSTSLLRKPRDGNSWSRPSSLLSGLSEVRYRGYFKDNTAYFTTDAQGTALRTSVSRTSSSTLPIWRNSTEMNLPEGVSIWWGGYFIPDETGTWEFQITSDDASFMWLGTSAILNYQRGYSEALIALPLDHPPISQSKEIYLEKDKIYPLRIQYGNLTGTLGTFNFEVKPPSFKNGWDSNLEGLIWSSDFSNTEDCTNYGISYTLTKQLGYGTVDVPACKNNPASSSAPINIIQSKPTTPTFSGVNFVGNNININVNIGSSSSSRPDKVYLVAPKLGINSSTPVEGKISGSTASWSLPLGNILSGVAIPLEIVGEKNGVRSEPLTGSYIKPTTSVTTAPPAPTNYTSRIVGSSAIITIQVSAKESSRATSAHLYSSALGIKKNPGLQGDVVGTKALIEVPIKASMAGKKYPITIYLKNSKGESTPLNATLSIPKAPKAPTLPTALPKPVVPKAVICSFGTQTRTFEDNCPPGWERR